MDTSWWLQFHPWILLGGHRDSGENYTKDSHRYMSRARLAKQYG